LVEKSELLALGAGLVSKSAIGKKSGLAALLDLNIIVKPNVGPRTKPTPWPAEVRITSILGSAFPEVAKQIGEGPFGAKQTRWQMQRNRFRCSV
jgi:hypothetical protein